MDADQDIEARHTTETSLYIYTVLAPERRDIDYIAGQHLELAAEAGLDMNGFASVDQSYESEGTLLVQVGL